MLDDPFLEAVRDNATEGVLITQALLLAEFYDGEAPTFVVRPSADLTDWTALGLLEVAKADLQRNKVSTGGTLLDLATRFGNCDGVPTKAVLVIAGYDSDKPCLNFAYAKGTSFWDVYGLVSAAETVFSENVAEVMHLVRDEIEDDE
jgi:hypothetical protein